MLRGHKNSESIADIQQLRLYYLLYYNKKGLKTNLRPKNHESPELRGEKIKHI